MQRLLTIDETCDLICSYAIEGNEKDLQFLNDNRSLGFYFTLDLLAKVEVPVFRLAMEKKHQAVQLLIKKFHADSGAAAEGYARIGEHEKASKLAVTNDDLNKLIRGYAFAGDVDRVNAMIKNGGDVFFAASGYALAGKIEQVEELISLNMPTNINGLVEFGALDGYLYSKQYEEAEKLILRQGEPDRTKFWAKGNGQLIYASERHLDRHEVFIDADKLLELLSRTNSKSVRDFYSEAAKSNISSHNSIEPDNIINIDVDKIYHLAVKINRIMREYHLRYDQAPVLLMKGVRAWMLQGGQNISRDVFMLITQQLTGMSMQDTQEIVAAVCKHTYEHTVADIEEKYKPNSKARFFKAFGRDEMFKSVQQRKNNAITELEKNYRSCDRRGC